MRNMVFKILGNLHVVVVGERDPSPADWDLYMEALQAEEDRGIDVSQMRTLVFSDGGGPTPRSGRGQAIFYMVGPPPLPS